MDTDIPVARIIRLVSKAIRYSRGGFSKAERRDLIASLLSLAADLADGDEDNIAQFQFTQPGPGVE